MGWTIVIEHFANKLPNNPENSDTFINKAVLTVASYTRTVYYKYNRILVLYHLPFASHGNKLENGFI